MSERINVYKTDHSRLSTVDFNNIPFGRIFSDHMFEADYIDGKWQNMQIKPFGRMNMHPALMALHYGQSIFEGMKASKNDQGIPLLLRPELHARRMNASARRMCMPEFPEDVFLEALEMLIMLDRDWIPTSDGSALYIRPVMFATDEFIGVAASKNYKMLIFTCPVGPYYSKPVKLLADHKYIRAMDGGVGEAKTAGNYAAALLPDKRAKEQGYDQVLWLDGRHHEYIQEVGTMNIFFVFEDKIVTPATDGAILKGITRKCIIQILREWGYDVEERKLTITEVREQYEKDNLVEVFGSGTAAVIANVSEIRDRDFVMTFDESDWDLSLKLKKYIADLRSGKIEDPFGWIVPIHEKVTA